MEKNQHVEEIIIETRSGTVRGRKKCTEYGPQFFYFHRIPYAKPPVGSLRFLPPVPGEKWTGILDGTQSATVESLEHREVKYLGCEDCLYLNIRTKNVNPQIKAPVMVWIGGIVYSFDISSEFCSGLLTDEDVVFVQVSFRIGVFGFLSVGEAIAPGNCGLKDVVMALRWIQDNISAFGGDPENVTLFGSSSGGSMVHYMMLSPMATGLFQKCIIQSGTALHNWAVTRKPVFATLYLAKELGIESQHPVEVVEKLRNIPELELLNVFLKIVKDRVDKEGFPVYSLFRPCIENQIEGQPCFITMSPVKIIRLGKFNKVPCIIGCNKMEGHIFKHHSKNTTNSYELYNRNLTELVPSELCVENPKAHPTKNIGLRLLQFYVPGDSVKEETTEHYFQFMSDYHFLYNNNKCVKIHSQYSKECPIYYYVFDHNGYWGFPENYEIFNMPAHAGELPYLFHMSNLKFMVSRDAFCTRQKMVKLWTNFAKSGNPTPDKEDELIQVKWDPVVDKNKLNFLYIGSELTKGCNPFHDRMSFWDNLLDDTTYLRICKFLDEQTYQTSFTNLK